MSPATLILLILVASTTCLELWDEADYSACNDIDGSYIPVGAPLKVVELPAGQTATWRQLQEECETQYPRHGLLQHEIVRLTEAQKGLCGGGVVPFGVDGYTDLVTWAYTFDEPLDPAVLSRMRGGKLFGHGVKEGAANLSSSTWWLEDEDTREYSCAVCQRIWPHLFVQYYNVPEYFEEAKDKLLVVYKVSMTGPNDTPLHEGLKKEFGILLNANVTEVHLFANTTTGRGSELAYHVITTNPALCHGSHVGEVVNGYRVTRVERADVCREDQTTSRYGNETLMWQEARKDGVVIVSINDSRVVAARKDCNYNALAGNVVWSEVTYWDSPIERCKKPVRNQHLERIEAWLLEEKNETQRLNSSSLQDIVDHTNRLFKYYEVGNNLKHLFTVLLDFGIVMARTEFASEEIFNVDSHFSDTLTASTLGHPFIGFTGSSLSSSYHFIRADDEFDVHQVSGITAKVSHSLKTTDLIFRMYPALRLFWDVSYSTEKLHGRTDDDLWLQCIVIPSPNNIDKLNKEDLYFDIYLYNGKILHWDAVNDDFTNDTCVKTSSRNSYANVYRCSLEYVTNHLGGIYYVSYEREPLLSTSDFIKSRLLYLIPLILESLFALIGLMSINLTAVFIKKWRQEKGNKILLHMTSSLTINLALSFFVTFADENTRTDPLHCNFSVNACMFLGIARHYSYLSMFLWMFVLSLLQVKRILTILGSNEHTNLLLKISAFAWGVPLLPVIILVSWSRDFYKPDRRGLCYPEGLAFRITIQGPATIVLVVNAGLYILITARIYTWFGWGKTKDLQRRGLKKKTIFKRRIMTSFCVFVLFGLMWTFHWLAEEGVLEGDVLYEYLFLSTASIHIFLLSLFFVFLDKEAMTEWKQRFKKR